jgi:hypothetical protein
MRLALTMFITAACLADTATTTQAVTVEIVAAGKLSVPPSLALAPPVTPFGSSTGPLPVTYRMRTAAQGGSSTITLQASGEFTPAGGPTLAGSALQYVCGAASLGTACSGAQVVKAAAQTPVVQAPAGVCTGGGSPCSATDPASLQIQFTLENDPGFVTGVYTVQLVLTISSL